MRAARLPAWSSPNFFTTAKGNAAQRWLRCMASKRPRSAFTSFGLPSRRAGSPSVTRAVAGAGGRLLRPEQPRAPEDEVAQRPPGAIGVLFEQAEAVHPELRLVRRHRFEGPVEGGCG